MENLEKVSVIIRTCNRTNVLARALNSVRGQTYKEIEVVVVEDGSNHSEKFVKEHYSDLNLVYQATGKKKGRTAAGNLGLSLATGTYFNFLDDDDIFYPNHVEILVKELKKSQCVAAYGIAEESQIIQNPENLVQSKEKRKIIRYQQPFNRLLLYSFNYLPIQSILFKRELYEKAGGFDENLDVLEDWDLWVRYSTLGDFILKPVVTSKYYVPYKGKKKKNRSKELDRALQTVRNKFASYPLQCNVGMMQKEMDYVLNVYNQKKLFYYMRQVWNYFVYGER